VVGLCRMHECDGTCLQNLGGKPQENKLLWDLGIDLKII
jgi:hypothetical protein